MRHFDYLRLVPVALIFVVIAFGFDLTRVDPPPSSTNPNNGPGVITDAVITGERFEMKEYLPLALAVLLPFGLGVTSAFRTPGTATLLLITSTLMSIYFLEVANSRWLPALFPTAIVTGAYSAAICVNTWAQRGTQTMEQDSYAEQSA